MIRSRLLRIILIILAVLILLIGIAHLIARPAPDTAWSTLDDDRPLVMAHQGGDGLRPGDTMTAFENAAALGVDVLEMDAHMTADGVIVLMHDETVDRTTDGTGLIKEMTLDQLQALDAGYDWSPDDGQTFPYRSQGVVAPTLEEVFQAFPTWPMTVEIKQTEPSMAAPLCALIREYGMEDRVLIGSFHTQAMQEFRAECPEVATSTYQNEVVIFFGLNALFLGNAYSPQAVALQVPEYRSSLHIVTARFVRTAHARNMQVHVWTVNEAGDMQRMIDLGVDGIITDYPDRLLDVLGR